MKAKSGVIRVALLVMVLAIGLVPGIFSAPVQALSEEQVVGSIVFGAPGSSVIGLVIIGNPGFEKTAGYPFPFPSPASFTTPFFTDLEVEGDGSGGGGRRVVGKNFDTTIVITNTSSTAGGVDVSLTFFDQAGTPINDTKANSIKVHLDPNGTQVRLVSNLLNP